MKFNAASSTIEPMNLNLNLGAQVRSSSSILRGLNLNLP